MANRSQDYELVQTVIADGDIPIKLYRNKITGLKVVQAYVECPIVKGDLCFATEAFDDDGLPHTLEHLVFVGSEDYPYRGLLDLLANRCMADGTNAFTDTDYTNYVFSTAGSDGFLTILPVYMEHVLFPTLTDKAYTTEVHHINGDGEDAGVVYCEMQACENTGESRCRREMLRSIYPGKCGYNSETGGIMANLRESTNNEKVRNYHAQFYHPKNMCVIVTGPVEADDIFKAIKPLEDKIVQRGMHNLQFQRPWQTPVEPLEKSVIKKIKYSSDTDDDGIVNIGFRGPKLATDYRDFVAISSLLDYLNYNAISPLQRDFVECEEPYCSSISHNLIENSTACIYLEFESVGKDYLDLVERKLFDLLSAIRDTKEKIDMDLLKMIISRKIVKMLLAAESSPHSIVSNAVIGNFLYGVEPKDLVERSQQIPILRELLTYDTTFWLNLLDKYFVGPNARYVTIVAEPSPEFMQIMMDAEKTRLDKQKETLKDDLPMYAEKLRQAGEHQPVPPSVLSSFKIPSIEKIRFHSIERVVLDETKIPVRFQYDSINTNFVRVHLLMNTSKDLSKADRLYLPLLSEILFECPIERDGQVIPYERVVAELTTDTVSYGSGIGISSSSNYSVGICSMLFEVQLVVEISKYQKAINWFNELLYQSMFTPERIKIIATKMLGDITQYKRSGSKVASSTLSGMNYQSNSNIWAVNFNRQQKFLKQLLKNVKDDPKSVQDRLTGIRDTLTKPNNILIHMALDKNKVDVGTIHEPWKQIFTSNRADHLQLRDVIPCNKLLDHVAEPKCAIIGVGSVESNYLFQSIKSIDSPMHPDLAIVYVLIQYLTQLEGPLWRQIRGLGLSYSYSIQIVPSSGQMFMVLGKSTHVVAAYNKAREIVDRHLSGQDEFDQGLLDSAKSSLIYELIAQEKSAAQKTIQSLTAYLRDLDMNFNRTLIKRVSEVTFDDMRRVGPVYLKPLFEDEERRVAISCNPSKVDEIISDFKSSNCNNLTKISLDDEQFLTATK